MSEWYSIFWRSSIISPWRHVSYLWLTPSDASLVASRLGNRVDKPWHFGGHKQWAMKQHRTGAEMF